MRQTDEELLGKLTSINIEPDVTYDLKTFLMMDNYEFSMKQQGQQQAMIMDKEEYFAKYLSGFNVNDAQLRLGREEAIETLKWQEDEELLEALATKMHSSTKRTIKYQCNKFIRDGVGKSLCANVLVELVNQYITSTTAGKTMEARSWYNFFNFCYCDSKRKCQLQLSVAVMSIFFCAKSKTNPYGHDIPVEDTDRILVDIFAQQNEVERNFRIIHIFQHCFGAYHKCLTSINLFSDNKLKDRYETTLFDKEIYLLTNAHTLKKLQEALPPANKQQSSYIQHS